MAPLAARQVSGESNLEKEIEKQMGCMAGFLQLFDRPQIISAKRFYSPKRSLVDVAVGAVGCVVGLIHQGGLAGAIPIFTCGDAGEGNDAAASAGF
ncbi:hypothetical protein DsansV1_C26g0190611 [Dioscorea sansibarensis]